MYKKEIAILASAAFLLHQISAVTIDRRQENTGFLGLTTLDSSTETPSTSSISNRNPNIFSGKRGLAYQDASLANTFAESSTLVGWGYNWNDIPGELDSNISYVPMLNDGVGVDDWQSAAQYAVSNGAKALFSLNEPDIASQANLSPDDAADLHVRYMNPYSGKILVGAPAVSNSNLQGQGLQWLQSFIAICQEKGCKYDFCNVHWYSPASAIDTLFDDLEQAHDMCGGKPIWLTEFAPTDASENGESFLKQAIPRLENLSYLEAYAYFMVRPGSLMSSDGSLSSLGSTYATES